jgi:hypothetical protein
MAPDGANSGRAVFEECTRPPALLLENNYRAMMIMVMEVFLFPPRPGGFKGSNSIHIVVHFYKAAAAAGFAPSVQVP